MNLENWSYIATVAALIVAVVAIVVSVILYRKARPIRVLSYCVTSEPREILSTKGMQDDVKIIYQEQEIDSLCTASIEIINTGNQSIKKAEIVEDLTVTLDEGNRLLKMPDIYNIFPTNLKVSVQEAPRDDASNNDRVIIKFDLLNPKEKFTLGFVYSGKVCVPSLSTRIEGLTNIKKYSSVRRKIMFWPISVAGFITFFFIIYMALNYPPNSPLSVIILDLFITIGLLASSLSLVIALIGIQEQTHG